ncbi:MAG: thymidine phosphorylase [Anaerolineales bacterium]|jgi:pyrimidine-nucleoside phosphorylase
MRTVDIIAKKRDGNELSRQEISYFIDGFTTGEIPDYQASAWAMAVLLRGMTPRETFDLTQAMLASGEELNLSEQFPTSVDKHSTGGVGDKTTLVVQPIVAAHGVPIGKMSGRGLGFTGGTLDKMESIDGFNINLSIDEFMDLLEKEGLVLAGQSVDLAPADGKLYGLRDVTATVPSIPLIASSIMSKKLAAGATGVVLDVKVGSGAFMKDVDQAVDLAELMVVIGEKAEKRIRALITDMNQPLGQAVGNALEVKEAVETLQGGGPDDFREHCLMISASLLTISGVFDEDQASSAARQALEDGAGLEKFERMVEAQGGNVSQVEDLNLLPKAPLITMIAAPKDGYLASIDAAEIGLAAMDLGAGRQKKGDPVDHAVGLIVKHKVGDKVSQGEPLFEIHARDQEASDQACQRVLSAHRFSEEPVSPLKHAYQIINGSG